MKGKNSILAYMNVLFISLLLFLQLIKDSFFSDVLFWAVYVALVLSMFFLMIQKDHKFKISTLILFDIFLLSLFTFNYPLEYQINRDGAFEAQFSQILVEKGFWDPKAGTGFAEDYYGYNPVMHFLVAFLSILSGYEVSFIAKYVIVALFRLLMIITIFVILDRLIKEDKKNLVYLAMFIYLVSARLRLIDFSKKVMGALFFLAFVMVLLIELKKPRAASKILMVLFAFLTVISDHSMGQLLISFNLFGLLFLIFMFPLIIKIFRIHVTSDNRLLFFFNLIVSILAVYLWEVRNAKVLLLSNEYYFEKFIQLMSGVAKSGSVDIYNVPVIYDFIQKILIYGSQLIILLLIVASFVFALYMLVKKRIDVTSYFNEIDIVLYLIVLSPILFAILLILVQTPLGAYFNVFAWFPLIFISLTISFLIVLNMHRKSIFFALMLLLGVYFIGGILVQYHPNVIYPEGRSEILIEFPEYKNPKIYHSASWLANSTKGQNMVIGDQSLFEIYSGNFRFDMALFSLSKEMYLVNQSYFEKRFLFWPVWTGTSRRLTKQDYIDFIAVNNDLKTHNSYLFNRKLNESEYKKFDSVKYLDRIYDNGKIIIYENKVEKHD